MIVWYTAIACEICNKEMVEETKGEGPRDPYAHVDLPREGEEEKNYVIPKNEIGSPTIDWNTLTFEEKKKMMISEELELERKKIAIIGRRAGTKK